MKAFAVIGANYGDEGKGLLTDYLCAEHRAQVVVRYNGGAQAGHTVVTPEGHRHVFSHFGSGSFTGAATYLSEFFVCNPILFGRELIKLQQLGVHPVVFVDRWSQVTTPFDMIINQMLEDSRGDARHGSCGVGFNETHVRGAMGYGLTFGDLYRPNLKERLHQIAKHYVPQRLDQVGFEALAHLPLIDVLVRDFLADCEKMKDFANVATPSSVLGQRIVFEGAQGLLLDQNNRADFPHLTRSNTGLQNIITLAPSFGVDDGIDAVYVTRSYLTRHGAGPFPVSEIEPQEDLTNVPHPYQGNLRFGELDRHALLNRILRDMKYSGARAPINAQLAVTHVDQVLIEDGLHCNYVSFGPTRNDVRIMP